MSHKLKNWMCEANVSGAHTDEEAMDWAADEIERLRKIIASLPRTADGVPVVPGMALWDEDGFSLVAGHCWLDTAARWNDGPYAGEPDTIRAEWFYSTREAAEAARNGKPMADEDPGYCPDCGTPWQIVRPGKSQPMCECQQRGET